MTQESGIVTAVCHLLQLYENCGKLYWIRNNSGAQPVTYQKKDGTVRRRYLRSGRRGSSDIIVWLPNRCIFFEVKTATGKLSPDQKEFAETIGKLGYEYYVVRSVDEVIKILNI